MQNFISVDGQQIQLTAEQMEKIVADLGIKIQRKTLAECKPGEIVKIGGFEMLVLEQQHGETSMILKDIYGEETTFGENNNYVGSNVDNRCQEFEKVLTECVRADNIITHNVDLTSNDGLKCYGTTDRKVSSLTADMYRKFVDILDTAKPDSWWWLATPWSTERHDNDRWALCVAPPGHIFLDYYYLDIGVRPFCILKSSIFVSS